MCDDGLMVVLYDGSVVVLAGVCVVRSRVTLGSRTSSSAVAAVESRSPVFAALMPPCLFLAVFDSSVPAGASVVEETQPDGKTVVTRRVRSSPSRGEMEEVTHEGPEREEVDVKEETEVLPDGTVHSIQRVVHHKVKHVRRSLASQSGEEEVYEADEEIPGTTKEDVLEMYEQPPKLVQESEEIEQVLPDGTKVKRQVVMSRMVHLVKMHHESFDEEHGRLEEEYEIEEVIPGTESAFVAGLDSDYEEEMEMKHQAAAKEQQQAMDDGREKEAPSPDTATAKLVSYQHGSEVDYGENLYDYGADTAVQPTRHGVVESTMDVVEDMIAKGQLTLEDTEGKLPCGLPPSPPPPFVFKLNLMTCC